MINIEIGPGEAYDRLSILLLKKSSIKDPFKRAKAHEQYLDLEELVATYTPSGDNKKKVLVCYGELLEINARLWQIEDDIRACEAASDFGPKFIELARSVYITNDQRHAKKLEIDALFGSSLSEQKEHTQYEKDRTPSEPV